MTRLETKLVELPIDSIIDTDNVRYDPGSIDSLALSIKTLGLINPLIVLLENGKYRLAGGRRRLKAMKSIGLKTAKCQVAENLSDVAALLLAVSDNTQRKQMSVPDIADAAMRLEQLTGKPDSHIAKLLDISPAILSQARSAMAELTDEAKRVLNGAPFFLYFALRKLPASLQVSTAKQAIDEKWTREDVLKVVKSTLPARPKVYRYVLDISKDANYEGLRKRLKDLIDRLKRFEQDNLGFDDIFPLL